MELTKALEILKNNLAKKTEEKDIVELCISILEDKFAPELLVLQNAQDQIQVLEQTVEIKEDLIQQKDSIIAEKEDLIEQKDSIIAEKEDLIEQKDMVIAEKESLIIEKDNLIIEKENLLKADSKVNVLEQ